MGQNQNVIQSSFVSGILSKDVIGRTDIGKYYNGVAEATNMIVEPLGGIKKRFGFDFLIDAQQDNRMIEFVFNTEQKYVVLIGSYENGFNKSMKIWDISKPFSTAFISVSRDSDTEFYTIDEAKELDFVQQADTMILTHGNRHPQKLVRYYNGSDVSFRLEKLDISNIPQYNWDNDVQKHDSNASRIKKSESLTEADDITSLRDEIMDAISMGEGLQTRIPYVNTDEVVVTVDDTTTTTTTTTTRGLYKYPSGDAPQGDYVGDGDGTYPAQRWAVKSNIKTIESQDDVADKTISESNTIVWDERLEDVINKAVRNRISLKNQDYNLMDEDQLKALVGADFSDEVNKALDEVLGTFEVSSYIQDVWGENNANGDYIGYPKYCAFYQNRLFFAGSPLKPMTIWGSVTNDYFNFDISESNLDSAIADTLNSTTLNQITGMFASKALQVFTTGSEYINDSLPITPLDSNWIFQSGIGTNHNVPLDSLDGSTLYIDRSGAIREYSYKYEQESYISKNLALLANQVIKNPSQMTIIRSSQIDLSKLVYFLNEDGTIAVLNIDNNEKILAWTEWETQGEIVEIVGVDHSLFVLVKRNGIYSFEVFGNKEYSANVAYVENQDVYLDAYEQRRGVAFSDICAESIGGGYGDEFLLDKPLLNDCTVCLDLINIQDNEIENLGRFNGTYVDVLLDGFYHGKELVQDNKITVDRIYTQATIGYGYSGIIKTLPLSNPQYANQLDFKRIIKIAVNMFESSGIELDGQYVTDRTFDDYQLGTKPELISGIREVYTLGWDRMKDFTLESNYPYKFHLLSLTTVLDSNGLV